MKGHSSLLLSVIWHEPSSLLYRIINLNMPLIHIMQYYKLQLLCESLPQDVSDLCALYVGVCFLFFFCTCACFRASVLGVCYLYVLPIFTTLNHKHRFCKCLPKCIKSLFNITTPKSNGVQILMEANPMAGVVKTNFRLAVLGSCALHIAFALLDKGCSVCATHIEDLYMQYICYLRHCLSTSMLFLRGGAARFQTPSRAARAGWRHGYGIVMYYITLLGLLVLFE